MKVHGEREVMLAAGSMVALALHFLVLALEELRCGRIAICNAHQLLKNYDAVRLLMMAGASGRSLRGRKGMVVPWFKWKPKTNKFFCKKNLR